MEKDTVRGTALSLLTALFFVLLLSSCQGRAAEGISDAVYPETAAMVTVQSSSGFDKFSQNSDGRIQSVMGGFYCAMELEDLEGNLEVLYQFRSDDDAIWWLLSAEEIGFVPVILDQTYLLIYDNNGTTPEHKGCDCPPEDECECEVYDDVLIGVTPVATVESILQTY